MSEPGLPPAPAEPAFPAPAEPAFPVGVGSGGNAEAGTGTGTGIVWGHRAAIMAQAAIMQAAPGEPLPPPADGKQAAMIQLELLPSAPPGDDPSSAGFVGGDLPFAALAGAALPAPVEDPAPDGLTPDGATPDRRATMQPADGLGLRDRPLTPITLRQGLDDEGGLILPPSPATTLPPYPGGAQDDPRRRFRRVAIVHYWLVTMRGGERVLERLLRLFPEADIFTHVYDPSAMSDTIRAHKVTTSFIQKLPGARRHYQSYLPLMPMALEHLDLRGYDLVISSESGPAKGVIAAPDALHLSYVHSPMRYLWDHYHDYREATGPLGRALMPLLCHRLRAWDMHSAARVDRILANSRFVQRRIAKAWRRDAHVLHPPVEVDLFSRAEAVGPAYLWVGQMVPYKRPDLAIDAFNALGLPLVMVGDGPLAQAMRRRAGPTITILPRLDFQALRRAYAQCRALVFPAEEDFGIVPVEVMASGRPVLAYAGGGALDSVTAGVSGQFFAEQTVSSLIAGVEAMEAWLPGFSPQAAQADARRFAPAHFDEGILNALR